MRRWLLLLSLLIATPVSAASPPVVRQTLSNGVRVQVSQQPTVPMVIVDVLVDAGSRLDPPGKAGLANLTADLLTEGAGKRTAEQIHEAADFIGASLSSQAGEDLAFANVKVVRKDLDQGLDLLFDCLLRPTFANAEVERRRTAILATIRAAEDNPGVLADRAFDKQLFGASPYGHPVEGWPDTVKKLGRKDVLDFYRRYYTPERSIVTVVGDVKPAEVIAAIEKRLEGWKSGAASAPEAPQPPPAAPSLLVIDKPLTQANIILGHRGVSRDNPDWYALTVMNHILGGGAFSSRLFSTVRTKGGLAYSIASGYSATKEPGAFKITMQTKGASAQEALAKVREEIARMRDTPVTEQELSEAKQYLTGSFPMKFDSNAKIAGLLAQIEFFGLGNDYLDSYIDRIDAVTASDVQRVAQKYLTPDEFIVVVVGPSAQTGIQQQP